VSSESLGPLQLRVLETLAGLDPPWTLTGGGALVGFHLHHRTTRDLGLFLHGRATLEDYAARVIEKLREAGLEVRTRRPGRSLHQLHVESGIESVTIDLVAEPVATIENPIERQVGDKVIQVDTPHEILVNKLCTLVQRTELRDLFDVQHLLETGGDLERALVEAPRKDGGFSPMILTWQLSELAIERIGRDLEWPEERVVSLARFRDSLLGRIAALIRPEEA